MIWVAIGLTVLTVVPAVLLIREKRYREFIATAAFVGAALAMSAMVELPSWLEYDALAPLITAFKPITLWVHRSIG